MENTKATPATKPTTTENYTPEQFNKLPKWAQNELLRLEKNVAYHKKRADVVTSSEKSNTGYSQYETTGRVWKNLPNNQEITFFPKENSQNSFDVKVDGFGRIEIYSNTGYPQKMVVVPMSSNVVAIEII